MNKKSKVLIISISAVVAVAVITSICLFFTVCNKPKKEEIYNPMLEASRTSVSQIKIESEVSDGEIIVYKFSENVKIESEEKAMIYTEKSKLNSSFGFSTTKATDIVELDRKKLIGFDFSMDYLKNLTAEGENITFSVEDKNLSKVILSESVNGCKNADFSVSFKDGKLSSLTCHFEFETGRKACVRVNCEY